MTEGARLRALWACFRQMRAENDLSRRVAAASVALLRGPLRDIDDRLCQMDLATLEELPEAEPGLASVN